MLSPCVVASGQAVDLLGVEDGVALQERDLVFLLFAEERGLLPSGELFEQGYGISRELDKYLWFLEAHLQDKA